MPDIARRDILRSAFIAPVFFSIGKLGQKIPDLDDFNGRQIRKIADPNNMTALERQHLIKLDLPAEIKAAEPFKATVSVPNHPMAMNHYIVSARIYLDATLVTFNTFAPTWQLPEATWTFTFGKGDRIDVVIECSEHGLWGLAVPIVITPSVNLYSTDSSSEPGAPLTNSVLAPPASSTDSVLAPRIPSTGSSLSP